MIALGILLPMILMGAVVPLLCNSWASNAAKNVSGVGAVLGWCVLGAAGAAAALIYVLLPAVGLTFSVLFAAALNILAGAAVFMLARTQPTIAAVEYSPSQARLAVENPSADRAEALLFFLGFGAIGFASAVFGASCARLFAMVMGDSVYVYNALIVVVLAAVGIGSIVYARTEQSIEEHRTAFCGNRMRLGVCCGAFDWLSCARIPFLYLRYFPLFRNSFGRQMAVYFVAAGFGRFASFVAAWSGFSGNDWRHSRERDSRLAAKLGSAAQHTQRAPLPAFCSRDSLSR